MKFPGRLTAEFLPRRLKFVLVERVADGPHTTPEFLPDGVPFLSVDGIQNGELVFDGCRYVSEADHREYRRKTAPRRDDLLMGKAASTGKIARVKVDFEFSIWSPLALLRVDRRIADPTFVEYALKSPEVQYQIEILCTSNTQKNISMDDIPEIEFPLPPLPSQRAIAAFLDRKTAALDALITKKERLIELLQEKRQAVITQAVTKGVDPNVPMKHSGVEWLGEIPTHWEPRRVKNVATFVTSGSRGWAEFYSETGPLFLRIGNLDAESVSLDLRDVQRVSPPKGAEGQRTKVRTGDVLVSITALIGAVASVRGDVGEAYVNQHLALVRPVASKVVSTWLGYALAGRSGVAQVEAGMYGGTKVGLGLDDVRGLWFCSPPLVEQAEISSWLDRQIGSIGKTIRQIEKQIFKIHEYRQALISAAVTGKIDIPAEEAA